MRIDKSKLQTAQKENLQLILQPSACEAKTSILLSGGVAEDKKQKIPIKKNLQFSDYLKIFFVEMNVSLYVATKPGSERFNL